MTDLKPKTGTEPFAHIKGEDLVTKVAEEMEVKEAVEVKTRKAGVTVKTLGAMRDQLERIKEAKLLEDEKMKNFMELYEETRETWIKKNM